MSSDLVPDINGPQPPIEGVCCEELIAAQLWWDGELEDPVNVVHLKFAGKWHRLYFDGAIVFWRESDGPPEPASEMDEPGELRLVDIAASHGLQDVRLASIDYAVVEGGASVSLLFEGGRSVAFTCIDDRTEYQA